MGLKKDKRGITSLGILFIIVFALLALVIIGVLTYAMGIADSLFSQIDGTIGNTSINETYQETLGVGINAMKTTFPTILSIAILLGMVLVLVFIAYKNKKTGRLWILFDIIIIIIAEILAVLVKQGFTSYINLSPEMLAVFRDTLTGASKFMFNLPIIIPTVGALVMLLTHFITKEKEEEEEIETFE